MAERKRIRTRPPLEPSEPLVPAVRARRDVTLAEFARDWLKLRSERTRGADTQRLRDHFLSALGARKVRELKTDDVALVVRQTLGKKGMKPKSARNAYDVFAELIGEALSQQVLLEDPRNLPDDIWPPEEDAPRPRFSRAEVAALTSDERLDADQRMFDRLAFCAGLPTEQVCGLRFDDWAKQVSPVFAAELGAAIEAWRQSGFESVYGRAPVADDFIVPRRSDVTKAHGEGSAYKAFRRACVTLGIKTRSPHAVANTFEDEAAARAAATSG